MYPVIRAVHAIVAGSLARPVAFGDIYVTHHRVWPFDGDMYFELNHARTLNLFEIARWRWAAQSRVMGVLRRERISFAIAGLSVRYRKRIPLFARFRMETRIAGWDDRFLYVVQSMWQGETCMNEALLRTAFRAPGGTMPPEEFIRLSGQTSDRPQMPDWVSAWIAAEGQRPWPPVRHPG